jgi:L-ascorbate metabolism protein UlaG (beta-lactamase superfamily)
VGGNYTIDAAGAKDVCAQLEPPMIIPMHYKTAVNPQWAGEGVDPFLEKMGGGKKIQATYVDLKKDELASLKKAVYVLEFR